jgi:hypothetical protein
MSNKLGANLKYVAAITILIGFAAFAWWIRQYVVPQLSVFLFIALEYAAAVVALSALKFRIRSNLRYIGGVIALIGFGMFTWWAQQYIVLTGIQQIVAFLYFVLGYSAVILAMSALKFRIRSNLKYVAGIIMLTGFGAFTWYAQEYVAPQLGVFFGFLTAYVAGVVVLFYILGRYGG